VESYRGYLADPVAAIGEWPTPELPALEPAAGCVA